VHVTFENVTRYSVIFTGIHSPAIYIPPVPPIPEKGDDMTAVFYAENLHGKCCIFYEFLST